MVRIGVCGAVGGTASDDSRLGRRSEGGTGPGCTRNDSNQARRRERFRGWRMGSQAATRQQGLWARMDLLSTFGSCFVGSFLVALESRMATTGVQSAEEREDSRAFAA